MTNPVMPNAFTPTVAAYSMDDPGGVYRTEVAGGASRYGLEWDRGMQRFQVTLILDALKFSVWTAFYHHIIRKGAVTFDMRLDSGFGAQMHAVNIMPGSYSAARTGGVATVVSFVVEAENQAYEMSADDAANMIDVYGAYGAESNSHMRRLAAFSLIDTSVLTAPAQVYRGPTLVLDFAADSYRVGEWLPEKPMSDIVSVSRAGAATRIGPTGLVESVAANIVRLDYNPITLGGLGLLVEESRTNLLRYSDQIDASAWTKTASTITANAAAGPDGAMTADKVVETTATSTHFALQTIAAAASTAYTMSAFVRAAERSVALVSIGSFGNQVASNNIYLDLLDGTFTATDATRSKVSAHRGGYYRAASTVTTIASAVNISPSVYPCQVKGASSYAGDGVSGVLAAGMQMEAGSFATSYIPTAAVAVTREADLVEVSGQKFLQWHSPTAGTFVIDAESFAVNGSSAADRRHLFSLIGGASGENQLMVYMVASGIAAVLRSDGDTVSTLNLTTGLTPQSGVRYRVGVAIDNASLSVSVNGGAVTTAARTMNLSGFTKLVLGSQGTTNTRQLNGHIANFAYHPRRLTSAELQAVTA